jgi:TonB-linked SusC/RagA family outer membrane protein
MKLSNKLLSNKLLRIARRLLMPTLLLAAVSAYAQSAQVTIQLNDVSVKEILRAIEEQSPYRFFYSSNLTYLNRKTSINAVNRTVAYVLNEVLKGSDLTYKMAENDLITISADPQPPKSRSVSGVVRGDDGEPLAGVSVVVKGTTMGALTDLAGGYSLQASGEDVLVFSFMGLTSKEEAVGERSRVDVQLSEDERQIEEIVVVGYGVQKKANLTGSVASINFEEQAQSRPVTNVSSALSGLSSGVQVMQTSGKPGEDGATIRIRGTGTLNDNSPLVIVDGMENSMDAVAPQDVESISILKDAASGAIYGSRAANGVILITTKKGKQGKANVSYSGRFSYAQPSNLIEFLTDYALHMELVNESVFNTNATYTPLFNPAVIDIWRDKSKRPNEMNELGVPNSVAYPNTDWQSALFGANLVQDHTLSVNGGSEKVRYLVSTAYLDNPGLVENTGLQRFSLRSSIESDVNRWLTTGAVIYATQEDLDMGNFGDANSWLRQVTPGVYPRWNGRYGYAEAPGEDTKNNPLSSLNARDGELKKTRANATLFTKVKLIDGLSWDFNLNYRRRWDEQKSWTNAVAAERVQLSSMKVIVPATDPSQLSTSFYSYANYSYTLENLLRYTKTFDRVHDVTLLAGYQEYYYYEYSNSGSKRGLMTPTITAPSTATKEDAVSGSSLDRATRSFFGRAGYAFSSRYLFEANLRYDGSSRYHEKYRWGLFPSVSGAWRISEEPFMESARSLLDNLKVRLSWGQLGNTGGSSVGDYEYQSVYGSANYPINGTLASGLAQVSHPNERLSWESTTVANAGVDVAILRGRLTFEMDLYDKLTDGILYRPDIYLTAGTATAPRMNIAQVNNRGVELTLGWRDSFKGLNYAASGNFAYNKNKVVKYKGIYRAGWATNDDGTKTWTSNLGDVSTGGLSRVVEGRQINEFYLKTPYHGSGAHFESDGVTPIPDGGPTDGMIRTEDDAKWLQAMMKAGYKFGESDAMNRFAKNAIYYGDYIYADNNGDGTYGTSNDEVFQGISAQPKYNFGMQASVAWKGFDVSMSWAGAAGFNLYWAPSPGYNIPAIRNGFSIPLNIAEDHYFYDPNNPADPRTNINAKYSRLVGESGFQIHQSSTLHMYNGSYLKLKNVTLGYTIPKDFSRKIAVEACRVYLSGENLWTLTKFPGQDPEMGANPGYVSLRLFAVGVNITF